MGWIFLCFDGFAGFGFDGLGLIFGVFFLYFFCFWFSDFCVL